MKNFILFITVLFFSFGTTNAQSFTPADFNGIWGGGVPITVTGNSVVIDMSSANRPNATGTVVNDNTIRVNHPDDRTYTGTLVSKNRIEWGPNNFWDRAVTKTGFDGVYRLKTMFRGEGECLECNQAGSEYHGGNAFMDKCQNVSGQLWKIEDAGNGYYRLKTQFRGEGECLEGNQADSKYHGGNAFMDKCQNVSGQLWKLEQVK
ncbi:MAG: RICIN domain-containing protein [Chitinophagales bacterium]